MLVIYNILEIIASFTESFYCYKTIDLVVPPKMQVKKIFLFSSILTLIIHYFNNFSLFSMSTLIIAILFTTITSRLFFNVALFEAFSISAFFSFCLIFYDFFSITILGFFFGNNYFAWDVINIQSAYRYIFIFTSKTLLIISYFLFQKLLIHINFFKTNRLLIIAILGYIGVIYFAKSTFNYIDINIVVNWLLLFIAAIFIIFSFIVYIRYRELVEENKIIEIRNKTTAENYGEIIENQQLNAQLYHDMKNHILVINSLLEKNKYEQMEQYVKTILDIVKTKNYTWTGNDVIDCIINIKKTVCEQKKIKMIIDSDPIYMELNAFVISTIFSNLLDNAIEASVMSEEEFPIITVSVRNINKMIVIKIENPLGRSPMVNNGQLCTQKKDKKSHGWGIKSVASAVEKAGGVYNYYYDSNTFTSVITLFILE